MSLTSYANLWVANRAYRAQKVDLLSDFAEGINTDPVITQRGAIAGAKTLFNEGKRQRLMDQKQFIYVDMSSTRPMTARGVTVKQFTKILSKIVSGKEDSSELMYYAARAISLSDVVDLRDGSFFINRLKDVVLYIRDNEGEIESIYRPEGAAEMYRAEESDIKQRSLVRTMRHLIAIRVKFP